MIDQWWRAVLGAADWTVKEVQKGFLTSLSKVEESTAMALHGRVEVLTPRRPGLDGSVHCDVVQARGLIPADEVGSDALKWTSDPFVEAQLLLADGTPTKRLVKTGVRVATLHPVFDEELLVPAVDGAAAVRFTVYDADLLSGDDLLGFVDVPLPPRPAAPEEYGKGASKQAAAPQMTQGWFPLVADEKQMAEMQPLIARLGRTESKTPLGELHVRVSWGSGVLNPELNHRPHLRRRLARLTVIIHGAEGLPPKCADRPTVVAQLENQTGVTPPAMDTTSPEWPREASTFVFAVTEVTSDLVLSVQDADPVMGAQQVGDVIIPVRSLQSGTAPVPQWATILPGRAPGEALLRPMPKPHVPLGRLRFSVGLEVEQLTPFAYLGPDVPKRERAQGSDHSQAFTMEALQSSAGRVLDCVLALVFAPLRTVLFLQSWQAPTLNVALLMLLFQATRRRYWPLTLCCAPLWAVWAPFLHGLVGTYYIRHGDPVPMYAEDCAAIAKSKREAEKRAAERRRLVGEAKTRLLEEAAKRDPSLAQQNMMNMVPLGAQLGQLGGALGSAAKKTGEQADHLNIMKSLMSKLADAHKQCLEAADSAERFMAAFDWSDPRLTGLLCILLTAVGLAASASVALVVSVALLIGLHANTVALLCGLACFAPQGVPVTRSLLAAVDEALTAASGAANITPLLAGAGLAATAPRAEPPLKGAELKKACEQEAQQFVDAQHAARQAELQARGQLRHTSLNWADAVSGAWLTRLLERAPNVPRKQHLAMTQRARANEVK